MSRLWRATGGQRPRSTGAPRPARLGLADTVRVAGAGLRTRRLRVLLSALGIAIGIAATVSVVGISTSSRADLDRALARLGTNLLTVAPGKTLLTDEPAPLPAESTSMIRRIPPVTSATATGSLPQARVYRNDHIPLGQSGGIAVLAADTGLPGTVGAQLSAGTWFNQATAGYPTVVLGSAAAQRLGVTTAGPQSQVWLGGVWFTVIGLLRPVPLAPELDSAALVGWDAAGKYLSFDGHPTTVYCRAKDQYVTAVRDVLAATANPAAPSQVRVSRPSDALAAEHATDRTFTGLLLGLGVVAFLVGGVGVANTMVISVLERRSEIGLRRCLGATRGQIRLQFLLESSLLSCLGGVAGIGLGLAATTLYAATQHWLTVVPAEATAAALGATVIIGAFAGIYPAMRAARLSPTEAIA
jgi:putative ABC transport system permease protein